MPRKATHLCPASASSSCCPEEASSATSSTRCSPRQLRDGKGWAQTVSAAGCIGRRLQRRSTGVRWQSRHAKTWRRHKQPWRLRRVAPHPSSVRRTRVCTSRPQPPKIMKMRDCVMKQGGRGAVLFAQWGGQALHGMLAHYEQ